MFSIVCGCTKTSVVNLPCLLTSFRVRETKQHCLIMKHGRGRNQSRHLKGLALYTQVAESFNGKATNNLYMLTLTLDQDTPLVQADDVLVDVSIIRWDFSRVLTPLAGILSDPEYQCQVAIEDQNLQQYVAMVLNLLLSTLNVMLVVLLACYWSITKVMRSSRTMKRLGE